MGYEVEIGQTLDSRFKILDVINRSGMASIFEAIDTDSGEIVAVKVPFMQFESDPGFYSRFQREEEIGMQLKHPLILRFVPVEKKSRPYIVSECLKGQTLGQRLRNQRPLPIQESLKIASLICEALAYMHAQGVIHRDLKPDNVMLCKDGGLRILDFGIARAGLRRITLVGLSSSMGTPDYMAPEQVKGQRGDARTDIYCLGALLYEMLTGVLPFEGDNPFTIMNARLVGDPQAPRQVRPEITPEIEEIVLRALERRPTDRYESAAEMKAALDAPEKVRVTGRALSLKTPLKWKILWRGYRTIVVSILIPLIVAAAFFLLRKH